MTDHLLIRSDVRRGLPFADGVFHCVVTSPPYFGLRDYGTAGQLGLERTPEEYVAKMVAVFREVRRVLRDDGTFWLNIGDCYSSTPPGIKTGGVSQKSTLNGVNGESGTYRKFLESGHATKRDTSKIPGVKPKDLIGIPWMLAFALRADGWHLRSEVIWDKPNPMPESVTDRPSRAHEQLFLLTKRPRYFYDSDAIRDPHVRTWDESNGRGLYGGKSGKVRPNKHNELPVLPNPAGANQRTVWKIPVGGYRGAHFATMPTRLAARCIKAGTSERGCCPSCGKPWNRLTEKTRTATRPGKASKVSTDASPLDVGNRDTRRHVTTVETIGWEQPCRCPAAEPVPCRVFDPFGGAGTTPKVATILGRHGFATELSADYLALARERMDKAERIGPKKPGAPKAIVHSSQQRSLFDAMEAARA